MTVPESTIQVRRTRETDWESYRGIRLEMLEDTPLAFGETLATAHGWDESEWRMRSARGEASDQTLVAAIDDATGRWIGTMGGFLATGPDVTGPLLVGVYVTPEFRGGRFTVAAGLLAEVEKWAAAAGDRLFLHVHETNSRAIGFYERSGFRMTGVEIPYSLDSSQREFEMVKRF